MRYRGIGDEATCRWYASIMLNRLMFVYFVQKKGFLEGDVLYLQTKLAESRLTASNAYLSDYLYPLFFECLAKPADERATAVAGRIGRVPYLNGGLFKRHQIELDYPNIRIADSAFEGLLNFFDAYQWHLDDRPATDGNEISPDVLGYIFERYVNQAQMGAYYTKEDITEYIGSFAILSRLLAMVAGQDRNRRDLQTMWVRLRENPTAIFSRPSAMGTTYRYQNIRLCPGCLLRAMSRLLPKLGQRCSIGGRATPLYARK